MSSLTKSFNSTFDRIYQDAVSSPKGLSVESYKALEGISKSGEQTVEFLSANPQKAMRALEALEASPYANSLGILKDTLSQPRAVWTLTEHGHGLPARVVALLETPRIITRERQEEFQASVLKSDDAMMGLCEHGEKSAALRIVKNIQDKELQADILSSHRAVRALTYKSHRVREGDETRPAEFDEHPQHKVIVDGTLDIVRAMRVEQQFRVLNSKDAVHGIIEPYTNPYRAQRAAEVMDIASAWPALYQRPLLMNSDAVSALAQGEQGARLQGLQQKLGDTGLCIAPQDYPGAPYRFQSLAVISPKKNDTVQP